MVVNSLSKMVLKNPNFVKKLKISCTFDHSISLKFHWHMAQTFLRNVWRDFRLQMSALATVARKSFNGKFTAKTVDAILEDVPVTETIVWC